MDGRSKNDMHALRAGARERTSSKSENDLFVHGAAPRGMTRRRNESDVQGHGAASRGMTGRRSEKDLQAHVPDVRERRHAMQGLHARSAPCFNSDGQLPQDKFLRRWERVDPDVSPARVRASPHARASAAGPASRRASAAGPASRAFARASASDPARVSASGPPRLDASASQAVLEPAAPRAARRRQPRETSQYAMNRNLAAWCAQERERSSKAAKVAKAAKAESSASTPVSRGATVTRPHLALLVMPFYALTSLAFWAHELLRTLSVDLLRHVARLVPGVRAAQSPQAELERCKEELKIAEAALARAQMAVLEVETRMKSVSVPCSKHSAGCDECRYRVP